MAKLQIQIQTDRADQQYFPGQSLGATIVLYCEEKVKIDKVNVGIFRNKDNRVYLCPSGNIAQNLVIEPKKAVKLKFEFLVPTGLEQLPDDFFMEVRAEVEGMSSRTVVLKLRLNEAPSTFAIKAGTLFPALLFSSIFLAFAALGHFLWLNGVPGKEIPYAVQWFGLICIIGGMFVGQKVLLGVNAIPRQVLVGIYLLFAALGYYVGIFNPHFVLGDPVFNFEAPQSMLSHAAFATDADVRAMHGLLLALVAGLFAANAFVPSGKMSPSFEFFVSIPLLAGGFLAICVAWAVFSFSGNDSSSTLIFWIITAVVSLGIALPMFSRPGWQNAHPTLVAAGAAPLMLLAIAEAFSGGIRPQSLVLAALLAASSGLIFFFGNRNRFAEWVLGKVNLGFHSRVLSPGANIVATLELTPRKTAKLDRIRTRLLCFETVRYYYNRETRYQSNTLLDKSLDFPLGQKIPSGQHFTQTIEVNIPMGLPLTSTETERTVWWEFDYVLMVDGAPDWSQREVIEVK